MLGDALRPEGLDVFHRRAHPAQPADVDDTGRVRSRRSPVRERQGVERALRLVADAEDDAAGGAPPRRSPTREPQAVARARHLVADVEETGALRPEQPLVPGRSISVAAERLDVDRHGARSLGAGEDRPAAMLTRQRAKFGNGKLYASRVEDVRE